MKIAIAVALLESEPRHSLKWAYLSQLLPILKAAGHEILLLSSHWGQEQKESFDLEWDLEGIQCRNFPATRDFLGFDGRGQGASSEAKTLSSPRIAERIALDSLGYTESLLTFLHQQIRTIDLCMFISLADPFALLGPLAFQEKSLLIPLLHDDKAMAHPYSSRALKFVGKIGCATQGEIRFVKESQDPAIGRKAFLLGLPGPAILEATESVASRARPLFFENSGQPRPPLNLELLRAFSEGKAAGCHSSDRFLAEDIRASFGGWIIPLDGEKPMPTELFQDSQARGLNALNYVTWLCDATNFVHRLEQNWTTNHDHPFERFRGRRVVIAYRFVGENDAVGYDVIKQCETFAALGIEARIYCQACDENLEDMRASRAYLDSVLQDPQGVLIYHLAINWPDFEDLITTARCYRHAKYHNITPKEFFQPYSKELMRDCSQARETLRMLVESRQFEGYWADSDYNRQELIRYGAPPHTCSVMAPYNKALSISVANLSANALQMISRDALKVLCVGRIAPNKGHKDLVWAVAEYVRMFDKNIELYIVGAVDPRLNGYLEEIHQQINACGLNDRVRICGRLSHSEIATLYHSCDVLLMLSYHEGFCVPIIEAQENRLPVIAYRTSALVETVADKNALCEVGDFYSIALKLKEIHRATKDRLLRSDILCNNA